MSCDNNHSGSTDLTNKRILKLIKDFSDSNWEKVYRAKDTLESLEHESLPYLYDLLNEDNRLVKLTNTADLIYPGTTEFYGHGWVIDYDLDWLTIRAGWAIEEITFQNFGFKENKITEGDLFELEMDSAKYKEYIKTGKYDFQIAPEKIGKIIEIKNKATESWIKNHNSWTRLNGVIEALNSADTLNQMTALNHLAWGNCIRGLDLKKYKESLEPLIERLMNSDNKSIKEGAGALNETVNYEGDFHYFNLRTNCLAANGHQQ